MYNRRTGPLGRADARGKLADGGPRSSRQPNKASTGNQKVGAPDSTNRGLTYSSQTQPQLADTKMKLESVMEANAEAMDSLRRGDTAGSHEILEKAMQGCKAGMQAAKADGRSASRVSRGRQSVNRQLEEESKKAYDAWLLAYSVTLSNLGCQLRRDNRAQEALMCLCEARDVEAQLCMKPSCSTMMNLSAVLLGMGEVEKALPIAKDCVTASQDGDRILFITALHNLAVTLGQQPSERERSAALPTMLRALREAQEFLGEKDPTTRMIHEKSSNTYQWIAQKERFIENRPKSQPFPVDYPQHLVTSHQPPPASASSSLNHVFPRSGEMLLLRRGLGTAKRKSLVHHLPPLEGASGVRAHTKEIEECKAGTKEWVVVDTPVERHTAAAAVTNEINPAEIPDLNTTRSAVSGSQTAQVDVKEIFFRDTESQPEHTWERKPTALEHKRSIELCGEKTSSVIVQSGLEMTGAEESSTGSSQHDKSITYVAEPIPCEQEEGESSKRIATVKSDASCFINMHEAQQPSFLRFAAVDDSTAPPAHLTYDLIRKRLRREMGVPTKPKLKVISSRSNISSKHSFSPSDHGDTTASSNEKVRTVIKTSVIHLETTKRQALLAQEKREEELFCENREREELRKRAQTEFESALQVIVNRTRERAATRIQQVWRPWWQRVGMPRRTLQLKLAEEREKRLRERLAAMADVNNPMSKKRVMDDWKLENRATPVVIVNCGRRWLDRTQCLRFLARTGLPHGNRNESQVFCLIAHIQAIWRGVLARRKIQQLREDRHELLSGHLRPMEEADYAATLIQKMYRSRIARQRRATLYVTRYTPPLITIQKWFRRVMNSQRARGVDTATVKMRMKAAVAIQKAWRAYQKRIDYYMARLREEIEGMRRAEKIAAIRLQSVCRGFLVRNSCRTYRQYCIEEQKDYKLDQQRLHHEAAEAKRLAELDAQMNITVPRTEYEKECLERAPEITRQMEDYEKNDAALFLEPMAERERKAWTQAIRLRPFDVERRRICEDMLCIEEVATMRRAKAATKIQREFRSWLAHRNNPNRDQTLLCISRGKYHQREYERDIQRMQYRRQLEKGITLYGDSAKAIREHAREACEELNELQAAMPSYTQPDQLRSRAQRLADEKALVKDETIIRHTYPDALARLREDLDEMKARTGTVVEHPYYKPNPCETFRRALDID